MKKWFYRVYSGLILAWAVVAWFGLIVDQVGMWLE